MRSTIDLSWLHRTSVVSTMGTVLFLVLLTGCASPGSTIHPPH